MARTLAELPKGSRITDYISLGVVAKTFPVATVKSVLDATGRSSRRQRELPAHVVVYYVIALALYMQSSYREVLRCLLEGIQWLLNPTARIKVTGKSGISQARTRLGVEPLKQLHDQVVGPIAVEATKGAWYCFLCHVDNSSPPARGSFVLVRLRDSRRVDLGAAGGVGSQGSNFFGKTGHNRGKPRGFGRRHPLDGKAIGVDAKILQDELDGFGTRKGLVITIQVMTFPEVSAHDDDAVGAFVQGIHHQVRVDHSRAHHPDRSHVGRILQPRYAGQIAPGIGTPVAEKADDLRFELFCHFYTSLLY